VGIGYSVEAVRAFEERENGRLFRTAILLDELNESASSLSLGDNRDTAETFPLG
jgi:hypothetical protein